MRGESENSSLLESPDSYHGVSPRHRVLSVFASSSIATSILQAKGAGLPPSPRRRGLYHFPVLMLQIRSPLTPEKKSDPPHIPLFKGTGGCEGGTEEVKVPLFKGDLGGSVRD